MLDNLHMSLLHTGNGVTLREELCYNCKNLALNKGHQNPKIRIENSHPNTAFISRHFCFLPLLLPALSFASFIAEGGQSGVMAEVTCGAWAPPRYCCPSLQGRAASQVVPPAAALWQSCMWGTNFFSFSVCFF